nr:MAG TPA: hypothetical protein [Caudoviricetes sp.]
MNTGCTHVWNFHLSHPCVCVTMLLGFLDKSLKGGDSCGYFL